MLRLLQGLAVTALLMFSVLASAEVYRWVDADGRVHFSDRAPASSDNVETLLLPEVEAEPGQDDTTLEQSLARQKRLVQILEEERLERETKKAEAARKAEDKEIYCARLAEEVQHLDRYTHVFRSNPDGSREYLSEQEMADFKARKKAQLQEQCGGG